MSVAFLHDGAHIVSGSVDRTIRVWDVKTGRALVELTKRHTGPVSSVAFSPNGAGIMAASGYMHIHMWTGIFTEDKFSPSVRDLSTSAITSLHAQGSWIYGSGQELLMWVPPEYCPYLHLPPHIILIAPVRVVVDTTHWVSGTDWVNCYTP
ncbi:hypothetical protein DFH08DRAFT_907420 [Mycena albidolilacea]|uniref:WD40 repeat-like protein n=1 Tax=Mycena albidolilacea TaxID=1033008 RepID=A0AAD6YY20_9AGAR|nr:hypothetical protein DFH08DRAFT_907420 [Mycena albidolilacea]